MCYHSSQETCDILQFHLSLLLCRFLVKLAALLDVVEQLSTNNYPRIFFEKSCLGDRLRDISLMLEVVLRVVLWASFGCLSLF